MKVFKAITAVALGATIPLIGISPAVADEIPAIAGNGAPAAQQEVDPNRVFTQEEIDQFFLAMEQVKKSSRVNDAGEEVYEFEGGSEIVVSDSSEGLSPNAPPDGVMSPMVSVQGNPAVFTVILSDADQKALQAGGHTALTAAFCALSGPVGWAACGISTGLGIWAAGYGSSNGWCDGKNMNVAVVAGRITGGFCG